MSSVLPTRPNLRHLKIQARDLLKACQVGDPEACRRMDSSHPRHPSPDAAVLADAQLVVAREYGFDSWTKLKCHVEGGPLLEIYSSDPSFYENCVVKLEEEARAGFGPALQRMRGCVPRFTNQSDSDIRQDVTTEDAKLVYAREHGRENWDRFCDALEEIQSGRVDAPTVTFMRAVEEGDGETVRRLLRQDPLLANRRTSTDKSPLHSAMKIEVAALLIEKGAALEVEMPLPAERR